MRTFIAKSGIVAVTVGLVAAAGMAIAGGEATPETRAYLGFSFGGAPSSAQEFHYGLRLDHDSRTSGQNLPAIVQVDFTRRGMNDLRLNGLSAVRQQYRMRQAEEVGEEMVDEPGFFQKVGNWFGNLFGSSDGGEADVAAADDAADDAPVDDVPADGAFLGYNALDWGLVAVGAVGLGFIATEVVNGKDQAPATVTPPPPPPTTLPTTTSTTLTTVVSGQNGIEGFLLIPRAYDRERQEWLDGGTGQMGDLGE